MNLTRREMLAACAAAVPAIRSLEAAESVPAGQKSLGVVAYCYGLHAAADRRAGPGGLSDPLTFIEYCRKRGAAGVQLSLGAHARDLDYGKYASKLREKVESSGMYVEGIVALPTDQKSMNRFVEEAITARAVGARVLRTVLLNTRRYETFDTAAGFRKWLDDAYRSLAAVEPVLREHKLRLAVENHKDLRTDEFLALLKRLGSPRVGICVDFGNNLALLEDPLEVVTAYAPLAFSTHVKDIAVEEYEDGFLMAEVPLGQGILDLPRMFAVLRRARPEVYFHPLRFNLEMLTRDPLKIPCLTAKYWATSENLPARYLARTLTTVRHHKPKRPLTRISTLTPKERLAVEEENVRASLAYAAKHLL